MHCEVGQFKACAKSTNPSTDSPCKVLGMTGSCKGVTGYPEFDNFNNPIGTVTIYSCKISDESTLELPGGGSGSSPDPEPEPTEAPKPEPTEAPKPEPPKPDPVSQSAIG